MPDRPGYTFLVCPDWEMSRQRLERLMDDAGGGFGRQVFWGDADDFPGGYWQSLSTVSLFAKPRTVILRRAEGQTSEFWESLTRFLAGYSPHVWPVICLEGQGDFGKPAALPRGLAQRPYWKHAQAMGWVWTSPGLTSQTLPSVLRDWAGLRHLTFAPGAREELARILPLDMTAASRELEKLELSLAGQREIMPSHLEVISTAPVMETFAFMRTMATGKDPAGVWRKVLGSELAGDEGLIFQFLGLLRYDAKVMWQIIFGEDEGLRLSPYAKRDREGLARRLGVKGLARLWDLAILAESAIKSGERSPDQAFEKLTAELSILFSGLS